MSIELMILLFIISIFLCAISGDILRRRGIQIPKMAVGIFHLIYITGLLAVYILL